jgi:hypothetical protein
MEKRLNENDMFNPMMSICMAFDHADAVSREGHIRGRAFLSSLYGNGYPEKHPEAVAAYMQAFALNVQSHGNRLQMALLELAIKKLSENIAESR